MSQNLEQVYNLTQLQPKLCEEILHNLERSVGLTKDDSAKFAPVSLPRSVGRSPIFVVNKASKCISGGGISPYSRRILTFSGAHTLCSAIQKSANCLESITCEALCEESVFFIAAGRSFYWQEKNSRLGFVLGFQGFGRRWQLAF